MSNSTPKLLDVECKFVVYGRDKSDRSTDYHYVKEAHHYDDGSIRSVFRQLKDVKRPYYITKKQYQTYKEKKDFELLSRVDKFESTQIDLINSVARKLNQPNYRGSLKRLCDSPYVYIADLDSCTYVKKSLYLDKMNDPTRSSLYKVAVFDTETNMHSREEEVIMATVTCGGYVAHAVVDYVIKDKANYVKNLTQELKKAMGTLFDERKIHLDIKIVSTPLQAIQHAINAAHKLRPDILAGWNMSFDIDKVVQACESENVDPAMVFSHPPLPNNQKFFKHIKSPDKKESASGRYMPIKNYDRWDWVDTPATFMIIDHMQAYKRNRVGQPELHSYTLANILMHEKIDLGKLKFEKAKHLEDREFHEYMQANYIAEYGAYNIVDCIAPEMLDEKTKDLCLKMPALLEYTHPSLYHKQPKHAANMLTYDALEQGYVFATAGESDDPMDKYIDSRSGWITAQPTLTLLDTGLQCTEIPELVTRLYIGAADSDVEASYPTNQVTANVSKITTAVEFVEFPELNVTKSSYRQFTMDILSGSVNSVTTMNKLCALPTLTQVSDLYDQVKKQDG